MARLIKAIPIAFLVAALGTMEALADEPSTFFGRYSGTGITQTPDASFFGLVPRDLDVQIGPEGDGFFVEWTTVIRDLAEPEPRRRTSRVSFTPTERPGFYKESRAGEPVTDGALRWAAIAGRTLIVNVVAILDDGGYGVQTYERTIRDSDEMILRFTSNRNGQAERIVTARLKRDGS
ncbi:MAG: hypothetical protein ACE5Q3_07005 [Alphaproteobacteria bacterium]